MDALKDRLQKTERAFQKAIQKRSNSSPPKLEQQKRQPLKSVENITDRHMRNISKQTVNEMVEKRSRKFGFYN